MRNMKRNALFLGFLLSLTCVGGCDRGGEGSSVSSSSSEVGEVVCTLPDYDAKKDELSIHIGGWVNS